MNCFLASASIALIATVFAASCRHRLDNGTDTQRFVKQSREEIPGPRIQLNAWQAHLRKTYPDEPPIAVTARILNDPSTGNHSFSQQLDIKVGPLSERQFESGRQFYRTKHTLKFEPGKIYDLKEFLHPQIQALLGHRLEPTESTLSSLSRRDNSFSSLYVAANCVSTAYEVLRGDFKEHVVFFALPHILEKEFKSRVNPLFVTQSVEMLSNPDSAISNTPTVDWSSFDGSNSASKNLLQSGDLTLIYGISESVTGSSLSLLHAAIWIDDGLYFEKPSGTIEASYRLATHSQLKSIYSSRSRYLYARKSEDSAWPHPKTFFKSDLQSATLETDWSNVEPRHRPDVLVAPGSRYTTPSTHIYRSVPIIESDDSFILDPKKAYDTEFFKYHPPK